MRRIVLNSIVTMLFMSLLGCGFHLRGAANLSDDLKIMRVEGLNLQRDIGLYLKRGLVSNGIVVAEADSTESAVLRVTENRFDRRVLSVGSGAKVSEFELHASITFTVLDAEGKVIAAEQQVQVQRDYQFDQEQVLGRESEEVLLRDQMNKQLVQTILRRLSFIK